MSSKKESTTQAFIITSWSAFAIGVLAYIAALWNMNMETETKGYYFMPQCQCRKACEIKSRASQYQIFIMVFHG